MKQFISICIGLGFGAALTFSVLYFWQAETSTSRSALLLSERSPYGEVMKHARDNAKALRGVEDKLSVVDEKISRIMSRLKIKPDGKVQGKPEEAAKPADVPLTCESGEVANVHPQRGGAHQMCVHNSQEIISHDILATGEWDPGTCQHIEQNTTRYAKLQDPSYWYVDVGGNIGYLSLCGYQKLPTVSIEAAPWNYKMISQTGRHWQGKNPDVPWHVVNRAVTMKSGDEIRMVGNKENYGGSTLVNPDNHPSKADGWGVAGVDVVMVKTATLDSVLDDHIPEDACIAFMKLDIEGFEHIALQSAKKMLAERPPCHMTMEYHTVLLKASHSAARDDRTPLELVALMKEVGYVISPEVPQEASEDTVLNLILTLPPSRAKGRCKCFGFD